MGRQSGERVFGGGWLGMIGSYICICALFPFVLVIFPIHISLSLLRRAMRVFGRSCFPGGGDLCEIISYGDKGLVLGVFVMSCHWFVRSRSCWDLFLLVGEGFLVGLCVVWFCLWDCSVSVSSLWVASSWSLQLIMSDMRC